MKIILAAYAVLRDVPRRTDYDEHLRRSPDVSRKRFWQRWENRCRADNTPASWAKLLFRFLLDARFDDAVELYEQMRDRFEGLDLTRHLELRDYMDCMFLLGERFEQAGRLEVALEHYEGVHSETKGRRRSSYLLEEIQHRIRNLLLKDLPKKVGDLFAHKWYERALETKLSVNDRAFVYKKRAECYARTGNQQQAVEMLRRAFEIKPNLKGIKKICHILCYQPPNLG